jgi:hypothetical protein
MLREAVYMGTILAMMVVGPGLAQAPIQPAPVVSPDAPQYFSGQSGTWQIRVTMTGRTLSGDIRCYRFGSWSEWGPTFEATLDSSGSFSVNAGTAKGWGLRNVSGTFPQLRVHAVNFDKHLDCPDGEVTLQKTSQLPQ